MPVSKSELLEFLEECWSKGALVELMHDLRDVYDADVRVSGTKASLVAQLAGRSTPKTMLLDAIGLSEGEIRSILRGEDGGADLALGCPECRGAQSCGQPHVYAIEMPKRAGQDEKMWGKKGGVPLYIGSSSHTLACVELQHSLGRSKDREYVCRCFDDVAERVAKPRSLTRKYGAKCMRYDLFQGFNPVTDGPEAEKKLAEHLSKTCRVYWK